MPRAVATPLPASAGPTRFYRPALWSPDSSANCPGEYANWGTLGSLAPASAVVPVNHATLVAFLQGYVGKVAERGRSLVDRVGRSTALVAWTTVGLGKGVHWDRDGVPRAEPVPKAIDPLPSVVTAVLPQSRWAGACDWEMASCIADEDSILVLPSLPSSVSHPFLLGSGGHSHCPKAASCESPHPLPRPASSLWGLFLSNVFSCQVIGR